MTRPRSYIFPVTLIILLSRIPFLFSGYGSEEDAWGLILTARNISLTGIYEVSRLPGHPVQELILSLLWSIPSWILNLTTAIVSTAGIVFFMLTLKEMQIRNYLSAGIFLAFTPIFYINSTNVMDYTWAISLAMAAFFLVNRRKLLLAGFLLGLACGFRVTAGAMVIPFAILLWQDDNYIRKILLLGVTTCLTALVCFVPVINVYGLGFFTFYEYFPYPPFLKNVYKGTTGAWGVPGFLVVITATFLVIKNYFANKNRLTPFTKTILISCFAAILLYTYSFLRIPQKSAFVIPAIPFIAILFAIFLNSKQMKIAALMMMISCFFAGIHLDDPIRGSNTSALSLNMNIGKTPVAFDFLNGPVTADHTKRQTKIKYARSLVDTLKNSIDKKVIIAGWWQNELRYFSLHQPSHNVSYLYYADESELRDSIAAGNKLYYLPEQDVYNDLRFQKTFTKSLAEPLN